MHESLHRLPHPTTRLPWEVVIGSRTNPTHLVMDLTVSTNRRASDVDTPAPPAVPTRGPERHDGPPLAAAVRRGGPFRAPFLR